MEKKVNKDLNHKTISTILCSSIISSLVIMLFHNANIDEYLKYLTLPLAILLLNFGIVIKILKPKINRKAFILLIPIILILISNLILEVDFSNLFLNIIILPILITIFFFSLINMNYSISRTFIKWCFKLFPSGLLTNLKYIGNLKVKNENEKEKNGKIINILIGIFIGGPIALLLITLLTSADQYFNKFIESIGGLFSNLFNIDLVISNLFVFVFFFIAFFSIIINIIKHKETKDKEFRFWQINTDISKTILTIINAVFILFLVSEISKITVNFLSLPIEYTYSEYAREGFFQLLFVTVINFSIISYYLYYEKNAEENKSVKQLLKLLICFSIILIFNSYYRMFLYIGQYGFTILRLQVILFLFMEFLLFSIMLKKIIYGLKNKENILFSIIIIVSYIINLYFCIQPFVDALNKLFGK